MVDDRPETFTDDEATVGSSLGRADDAKPSGRRTPKLGDTIGRYVLLRPIASGGMGLVWAAWDPELDRNVALKLLLPRKSGRQEREALVREARALARLSHPHVVQVYDVGTWGDEVWVALEYLGGTSLDRWVKARPRGWSEVLDVLIDAGRGLAAAHAAGLVHLDVKPSNVVVGDDALGSSPREGVRVLDFGLARRVQTDAPPSDRVTSSRGGETSDAPLRPAVGTVGYIAPELLLGLEPGDSCDQFGFCVMAWEQLVGVRPFPGRARSEYERAVLGGRVADPPQGTRVPGRVLRVLRRGLATKPEQRFADMPALLAALERARVSWVTRAAAPVGLAAVALVAAFVLRPRTEPMPACDAGEGEFVEVWSPSRRASVERAFAASGEPYAGSAWASVAASLDAWGERWAAALDDACASAAVSSEEVEERKGACLRGQLHAVDALAAVFVAADAGVVERAGAAARALPGPEECADIERLARRGPAPADETLARRSSQARALLAADRLAPASELGRAVAREAEAGGAAAIAAEAHLVVARAESRRGAVADASDALHRAMWAAELAGDDELRADAFTELVFVAGHLGDDTDRAHWYASESEGILTRIGATSDRRSVLAANLAVVLADEGRYAEAISHYRDAIELRIAGGFGADDVFATLLADLGSVYMARSDYGAAAAWFTQAYALRVVLAGPDHPDVADVLVDLGNVLQLLGHDDAALAHYRRAIAVLEGARGKDEPALRIVHNDIAVVLAKSGHDDEALAHHRESLRLWRLFDRRHPMIGVVQHDIAQIHANRGEYDAALPLEGEALAVLQHAWPDGHPDTVAVLGGLGRAELERGDAAAATRPLRAALAMGLHVDADPQVDAEVRFTLARALVQLGRERTLARRFAVDARHALVQLGARATGQVAELDAWWVANGFAD